MRNEPIENRVAAELLGYTEELDKNGDVYSIEYFVQLCESRGFIDYDGYGHPVLGGKLNPRVWVKPSRVADIPKEATHVVWYNR